MYPESRKVFSSGLVDGAGESIMAIGGLSSLTGSSGSDMPMTVSAAVMNDTVGGAAFGFGRGLGSEGVKLVMNLFGKRIMQAPPSNTTNAKRKRSTVVMQELAPYISASTSPSL